MKILFISGYAAWYKVSEGKMASHHIFGFNEMIDHYYTENKKLVGVIKEDIFENSEVHFYHWEAGKKNIIPQIRYLYKKRKEYDVYFDALNRCSIYLGVLKKLNMFKTKLITVMHHPSYKLQLVIAQSDAYIFFDEKYRELAMDYCNKKCDKYYVNEWYPDIKWYKSIKDNQVQKGFFIDNGKSRRDHELLIKAVNELEIMTSIPRYMDDDFELKNIIPYEINLEDDFFIVKLLKQFSVVVIPIQKNNKNIKIGPLGITSFLDAVALGMPVIASDNVCFANYIVERKIGLTYRTGNYESLKEVLYKMYNDKDFYEECRNNMKIFSEEHSVDDYSTKVVEIIKQIMKCK